MNGEPTGSLRYDVPIDNVDLQALVDLAFASASIEALTSHDHGLLHRVKDAWEQAEDNARATAEATHDSESDR